MNTAAAAYGRTAKTGLSPRHLEAEVLLQCARDLQVACGSLPGDPDPLIAALEKNRRAWSLFSESLRYGETDLPPAQRTDMLRLAAFVFARSFEAAGRFDPRLVAPLVSINRTLAAGLRGEAPAT